jgi:protein tyrosine phosphatase (PTP) superfamily phosphohydrolase (DUF442 family)
MTLKSPVGCESFAKAVQLIAFLAASLFSKHCELSAQEFDRHPHRLEAKYLPNAIQVIDKLISGGLPMGDDGFAELGSLGVKTIISVDGARPDVESAKKYGLRYVHLPHGYDGVPEARGWELAKAIDELSGPIYLHCHHGQHRSPTAAAVACIVKGDLTNAEGKKLLEIAGTDLRYVGLWSSVAVARAKSPSELAELKVEYREIAEVAPLANAMVELDRFFEILDKAWTSSRISKSTLSQTQEPSPPPPLPEDRARGDEKNIQSEKHTNLAELGLLFREQYTEMLRLKGELGRFDAGFRERMLRDESYAMELESLIQSITDQGSESASIVSKAAEADRLFHLVRDGCKNCHAEFRDKPLQREPRFSRRK